MKPKTGDHVKKSILVIAAVAAVLAGGVWFTWSGQNEDVSAGEENVAAPAAGADLAEVNLPAELSDNAVIGKRAFEAACAVCHGENAAGRNGLAPPLVHVIYEPGHHGDEAFQRAAASGVRAHHWRFGDMPPVEGVTRADVSMIVAYIRELQRANGIN